MNVSRNIVAPGDIGRWRWWFTLGIGFRLLAQIRNDVEVTRSGIAPLVDHDAIAGLVSITMDPWPTNDLFHLNDKAATPSLSVSGNAC
jgi:hypothetical protein